MKEIYDEFFKIDFFVNVSCFPCNLSSYICSMMQVNAKAAVRRFPVERKTLRKSRKRQPEKTKFI